MIMARWPWSAPQDYARLIRDCEWEAGLVERIRLGCAAPRAVCIRDLIDDDRPYRPIGWEEAEKNSAHAVRTGAAYLDDRSIAERAKKREALKQQMEELKIAWRDWARGKGPKPLWGDPRAETESKKKAREYRKAEEAAAKVEALAAWRAEQEKRKQREREAQEAWDRETRRQAEVQRNKSHKRMIEEMRILSSKWTCLVCGARSTIGSKYAASGEPGYQLTCLGCGKAAWGSHSSLMKVVDR